MDESLTVTFVDVGSKKANKKGKQNHYGCTINDCLGLSGRQKACHLNSASSVARSLKSGKNKYNLVKNDSVDYICDKKEH